MARLSVDLQWITPASWVQEGPLSDFDAFLADHANCERKASALAMSLIVRFPDRKEIIQPLIDLALEELEHFRQVYRVMVDRGVELIGDTPDLYVNRLLQAMRHGREERFIDTLLVSSLIECRGAERFRLIADALKGRDGEMSGFYRDLWACEAKHGHLFVEWALHYYPQDELYQRLHALAEVEAEVAASLPTTPSLH
ncbi:MAG: tRNA-(ms[2]io[6]A)-hydroxylase [Mariprofundales bacterium]|nr:tRNA-(ms[2]io[6]A)-hydroxylase [Mariprofundales bacterium]